MVTKRVSFQITLTVTINVKKPWRGFLKHIPPELSLYLPFSSIVCLDEIYMAVGQLPLNIFAKYFNVGMTTRCTGLGSSFGAWSLRACCHSTTTQKDWVGGNIVQTILSWCFLILSAKLMVCVMVEVWEHLGQWEESHPQSPCLFSSLPLS